VLVRTLREASQFVAVCGPFTTVSAAASDRGQFEEEPLRCDGASAPSDPIHPDALVGIDAGERPPRRHTPSADLATTAIHVLAKHRRGASAGRTLSRRPRDGADRPRGWRVRSWSVAMVRRGFGGVLQCRQGNSELCVWSKDGSDRRGGICSARPGAIRGVTEPPDSAPGSVNAPRMSSRTSIAADRRELASGAADADAQVG
jgi:hypothetical protein